VKSLAAENVIPGGTLNNMDFVSDLVEWDEKISNSEKAIFCDAQTSGGLLIALPKVHIHKVLESLSKSGIINAKVIGNVVSKGVGKIFFRKT